MEFSQALSEETGPTPVDPAGECPRCGEPCGPMPPVEATTLAGLALHRCGQCGTRHSAAAGVPLLVLTCAPCGGAYAARERSSPDEQVCDDCSAGRVPGGLPDRTLVQAMEREARAALQERWKFVGATDLSVYLDRITRQMARHVEGAPADGRVFLVSDWSFTALALPSGVLLLSLGLLDFLQDEAELAFVLGHELVHAASGDVATGLVRCGFHAATHESEEAPRGAWAGAVLDLVRLGHGSRREREADRRALDAVTALGYDTESVFRFLRRLRDRIDRGDPRTAELALAHPPVTDRIRRLEKSLFGRPGRTEGFRVNREVFRRAASGEVLRSELRPVRIEDTDEADRMAAAKVRRGLSRAFWVAGGILVLAAAILAVGLLLSS